MLGGNLCIELQRGTFAVPQYETAIMDYASSHKLLVVATNETYFEASEDYEVYEVLRTISKQKTDGVSKHSCFKGYYEMLPRYSDVT